MVGILRGASDAFWPMLEIGVVDAAQCAIEAIPACASTASCRAEVK